jgi:hypothetical protein
VELVEDALRPILSFREQVQRGRAAGGDADDPADAIDGDQDGISEGELASDDPDAAAE